MRAVSLLVTVRKGFRPDPKAHTNMKAYPIGATFVLEQLRLSWTEVLWGYRRQYLGWSDVVEMATRCINQEPDGSDTVIELASLTRQDAQRAGEILEALSRAEATDVGTDPKRVWLFLILAWLYANRDHRSDPLGDVERVYADFEYPEEIAGLVRYMPAEPVSAGIVDAADKPTEQLYSRWRQFVTVEKARLQEDQWRNSSARAG